MNLAPERIDDLSPERRKAVMERSMEDISSIYEDMRKIVADVKSRGDAVALAHYRKHKDDIMPADLEATQEEIEAAYGMLDPKVVDCLKVAAGQHHQVP